VDVVATRIPTWKGSLLNGARRAMLVQSTLSAIPVHISICCCLSTWAVGEIDKHRRAFLWTDDEKASGDAARLHGQLRVRRRTTAAWVSPTSGS
jgi:hypothetical protein